ncbi:MAG: flagellar hook-basal body complex protein FliE [Bryobacteraceae bacterium]|jgi:flagellar hook-basal body complex protein FliE
MSSPISPISPGGLSPAIIQSPTGTSRAADFQSVLESAIGRVEELRNTASQSVERFLAGENAELHETVLATQRAELAFELFLEVRNKVVQAYQEVMRMQM